MADPDLIRRAKDGESIAWSLLYEMHYPWLYGLALKYCHNLEEAKDTVQNTFISAFLKLHQLKDSEAFPAWIKAILVHQCMRMVATNSIDNKQFILQQTKDEITEKSEEEFLKSRLHNVLATLPEALRSVLLLRYFSGWNSYEQLAEILNIPLSTVRSRLNQAKAKLSQTWRSLPPHSAGHANQDEWGDFYQHHFLNLNFSQHSRDRFLSHLNKNLELYRSGKVLTGRHWIEQEIEGDLQHGSYFKEANIISSGNISVVEVAAKNSSEHPDRCPSQSVIVLFRKIDKVERLHFYSSR